MRIREGLTAETIDDELVVLDLDGGRIHALNATASAIWQAVAAGCAADDIVATLCAEFDVTQEVASTDVDRVLHDFVRLGLVETQICSETYLEHGVRESQ